MNSVLFSIPASIIVGLLVGKLGLACLHMPLSTAWIATSVIVCTLLLMRRSPLELGAMAVVSILAEMQMRGIGSLQIPADILLAIIVSMMLLPVGLSIMGINNPGGRRRATV